MATTKDDHVLTTLRTLLANESAFNVVKVYYDGIEPTAAKAVVYTWVMTDNYGSLAVEMGHMKGIQTLDVGIFVDYMIQNEDVANAGTRALKHAEVKERLELIVQAFNASCFNEPYSATTTVGSIGVNLHKLTPLRTSGVVDNRDRFGALLLEARITYTESNG